jgi:hypothetical protein
LRHNGSLLALTGAISLGLALAGCAAPETPDGVLPESLAAGFQIATEAAETGPSTTEHRWHAPHKQARKTPRVTPDPVDEDWNPLAAPAHRLKQSLEAHGITQDTDLAIIPQRADGSSTGDDLKTTIAWQSIGDWLLAETDQGGKHYLAWIAFGAKGLDYNTDRKTLSGRYGILSDLNGTVEPDPIILDEFYYKYVAPENVWLVAAGKVDLSYHFDTNRVANDSYNQFLAFSLVNNLSIPFPSYGSFGGWARVNIGDGYVMLGAADSAMFAPVTPWKTLDENSWYQIAEVGVPIDSDAFGKGTIRLTPWHNHLFGEDGWGLGLNVDQELGSKDVIGFLRAGHGDEDVTPVKGFLSGGVAVNGLFDRPHDTLGVGASWSDPARGNGTRSETLIESYYSIQLSPSVKLIPDVQVALHPAQKRANDSVVVGALRLVVHF